MSNTSANPWQSSIRSTTLFGVYDFNTVLWELVTASRWSVGRRFSSLGEAFEGLFGSKERDWSALLDHDMRQ